MYYGDGSRDQVIVHPTAAWTLMDVTSILNPAKILVGIRIWGYSGAGPDPDSTYIDDVSIHVSDPVRDVGVVELIHPRDTVEFDTTHIPLARVANFGDEEETLRVVMRIEDICDCDPYYYDTTELSLPSGDTVVVSFAPWTPMYPAMHRAKCWTVLPGDSVPGNDTLEHFFYVQRLAGIAGKPCPPGRVGSLRIRPVPANCRLHLGGRESAVLFDAAGRHVLGLVPGDNDVRHLSPGVYFVCSAGIDPLTPNLSRKGRGSRKVIIQR